MLSRWGRLGSLLLIMTYSSGIKLGISKLKKMWRRHYFFSCRVYRMKEEWVVDRTPTKKEVSILILLIGLSI